MKKGVKRNWVHSVMVSTRDSDSRNLGSNPGGPLKLKVSLLFLHATSWISPNLSTTPVYAATSTSFNTFPRYPTFTIATMLTTTECPPFRLRANSDTSPSLNSYSPLISLTSRISIWMDSLHSTLRVTMVCLTLCNGCTPSSPPTNATIVFTQPFTENK